jgi:hypothetical protein
MGSLSFRSALLTTVVGVTLAAGLSQGFAASRVLPPYLSAFPNFARTPTPQMPGDVDITLKEQLEKAQEFTKVQREFDLYSWQMFLALNWPTDDRGEPAGLINQTFAGPPHWTLWHDSSEIFEVNGATPNACAQTPRLRALALTRNLNHAVSRGLPPFQLEANATVNSRTTRFLGVLSAVGELNAANLGGDIQQAFSGPLIDQNGNFVFYEILIDPNEVGYLCDNKLYNINGEVDFSKQGGKVDMPTGHPQEDWSGSFELKLAWRIMTDKDDQSRFFVEDAYVMDQGPDGKPLRKKVKVGLVGMHIGHKSETSPQWIWATFEQVDNLDVDQVAHPNLRASFNSPDCPICTTNVQPQKGKDGVYPRIPVQLSRTIPIPADKVRLNAEAQSALGAVGSVWQYYQLIDTQWPTDPKSPPSAWDSGLAQSVTNKSGGQPTPVFLTNMTMESYFQSGNQPACNQEEDVPATVNCPAPYASLPPGSAIAAYTPAPVDWNSTQNNGGPVKPGISTQIFATESCMGCHSSAGLCTTLELNSRGHCKTTAPQLSADFSWLLSQKAQLAPH